MTLALIILAAGKGTRMRSDLPKVLHPIAGAPLVVHAMEAGKPLSPERCVVVAGHGAELVRKRVLAHDPAAEIVLQTEQLGTAHAVDQARAALQGFEGDAIVLYGDTPFVSAKTLGDIQAARTSGADVVVLGFEAAVPGKYGRLVVEGDRLTRIVEAKDATPAELGITLCNSGVVCADSATLFDLISKVGNDNASGEYYLTDIVDIANADGKRCVAVTCDEAETLGVNSRVDLAAAEAVFQASRRRQAMEEGATLVAPETAHFAYDTKLGRDVLIEPNVVFGPGVVVEDGVELRAFSHLEGCHVGQGSIVGPYARLRPGSDLAEGVKIGNFVETKNAVLAKGAKVNHLSYIGDASVGAEANIGAGTITCNYDGVLKHHTEIGENAFIGSNSALVAPVKIGARALVGAGSVISRDVPDEALAMTRAKQEVKPGLAAKLRARLLELKASRKK
ncbi:bifunctional UDP-N-acetylglucosamine diphosphorylase/glucosamine-1-phosphate N-acetyltransferase GlmU [Tropicibacter sp. Alg240-R139]|uniref:bifunctional UDP-N-acetylglucosamine diphosphorylase/glucosamine-1-phosphate N-acetyltransferase GlmU n=1 Tax=Tropicibacter sp. Alg240-R139 TaxID=2305991 RepID=UPI0013E02476|nr:bifunctional UDP-N-acetylglucosamine diphosphorylase/glucosamine-1-phosphate N-acetyltransferase GlmU [Tropicibacter sp. Alg240-R139]